MATQVNPIPAGYHSVTSTLIVSDVSKAIDFYKKAFGAEEIYRMECPQSKSLHAEIKIGDSRVMLSGECTDRKCLSPGTLGGTTSSLYLYVKDVDAAFNRAVTAGAKVSMPLTDMFWGDRFGDVVDPSGHHWALATHKEDLTPDQIKERAEAFFASTARSG